MSEYNRFRLPTAKQHAAFTAAVNESCEHMKRAAEEGNYFPSWVDPRELAVQLGMMDPDPRATPEEFREELQGRHECEIQRKAWDRGYRAGFRSGWLRGGIAGGFIGITILSVVVAQAQGWLQ